VVQAVAGSRVPSLTLRETAANRRFRHQLSIRFRLKDLAPARCSTRRISGGSSAPSAVRRIDPRVVRFVFLRAA
jgi:hypothetical protein